MNNVAVTPTITPRTTSLLDYAVLTDPNPMRTGQPAALDIFVSNPTSQRILCKQLSIAFRIGDNAQDLATSSEHITNLDVFPLLSAGSTVNPDFYDWTAVRIQDEVITLVPQEEYHKFLPAGGTEGGTRGIRIHTEKVLINKEPGTTTIDILETATTPDLPWPDSPTTSYLHTQKYSIKDTVKASSIALWTQQKERLATRVEPGAVTLVWDGPKDLRYKIQKDRDPAIEVKTGEISYEFDDQHPITRDATFTLIDAGTNTPLATTSVTVTAPTYADLRITGQLDGRNATSTITTKLQTTTLTVDHGITVKQNWNVEGTVQVTKHGRVAH